MTTLPVGIDPGWGHTPERVGAHAAAARTSAATKIGGLDPTLAAAAVRHVVASVGGFQPVEGSRRRHCRSGRPPTAAS